MTMTRYATIDLQSGYVWGVTESADPASAVSAIDAEANMSRPRIFETTDRRDAYSRGGYALYAVPDALVIDDGQDRATIAAVESARLVGYYAEGQFKLDRARFAEWLAHHGRPGLIASVVADEAEDVIRARLDAGEDPGYELGSADTLSGNPAVYHP